SMTEYYLENSYGDFEVVGDVAGWYTAANNASYYTNYCDESHGMGSYPNNSQKLIEEAVDAADASVDFSNYDNNNDGFVDGLFVVHAGTGYEDSGNDCEIHSHAWGINYRYRDGVVISGFSIEPEEEHMGGLIPIGVFCHEFGHMLGLPDLYDTDYSSSGIGRWGVMAGGSWNGNSRIPAQFCAWSKSQLGWMTLTNITANQTDVDIPAAEWNPTAYRLWRDGTVGNQYFIVENRQRVGFDAELPGEGLLIWHIDHSAAGNHDDWHPTVMLEQADGKFDLQYDNNNGDGSDPFPYGGVAPYFHDKTVPNSKDYINNSTEVAVWNISAPDSIMTADFDIEWSRPYFELTGYSFSDVTYGDGDGFLEEGETIEVTFSIDNDWKEATGASASLTVDDALLAISDGSSSLGTIANGGSADNGGDPFLFDVPAGYTPRIDSFFIEISSDGGAYTTIIPLEQNVGATKILLVDDDNNDDVEQFYTDAFYDRRSPFGTWDKYSAGGPSLSDLSKYEAVFWFTGDYRSNPLTTSDISAMSDYMDGGGKLFLTGQGIAKQLSTFDPTFLSDYLRADYLQTLMIPLVIPESGGDVLAGLDSMVITGYGGASNQTAPDWISAVNGGVGEAHYHGSTDLCAVSYDGIYKLVFFTFGYEAIITGDSRWAERDSVYNRILEFFELKEVSQFPELTDLAIGPGAVMNMTDHTPDISWTYYDEGSRPQEQYQIEVGSDADWTVAEMWDSGPVSGSGTSVTYGGSTLNDGQTYYYRTQVYNGLQWSNWETDQFRMNSIPSTPSGETPDNMTAVTTSTPALGHQNANDGESDVLTYSYELYNDELMTSLVTAATEQPEGVGSSSWTVDMVLSDDQQYYWRVRADDGLESGGWSDGASFWVNSVNEPPTAFSLLEPADETVIIDVVPNFVWGSSLPGDLIDEIAYKFIAATDSLFSDGDSTDVADTTYGGFDSLALGTTYFWKVLALDNFGGVTASTEIFSISTWVPGDANGDGDINVGDAVYMINYVFKGGDEPIPVGAGDANGDCTLNVGDGVYLINYVFKGGDPPIANPACVW
ncbi:MAG: M6 family metalloprotease domain-containing protein, partial [FCB group bacterium]|nr:M6 family metalloprotease domain-containing protein [FCB group bacterium]